MKPTPDWKKLVILALHDVGIRGRGAITCLCGAQLFGPLHAFGCWLAWFWTEALKRILSTPFLFSFYSHCSWLAQGGGRGGEVAEVSLVYSVK